MTLTVGAAGVYTLEARNVAVEGHRRRPCTINEDPAAAGRQTDSRVGCAGAVNVWFHLVLCLEASVILHKETGSAPLPAV